MPNELIKIQVKNRKVHVFNKLTEQYLCDGRRGRPVPKPGVRAAYADGIFVAHEVDLPVTCANCLKAVRRG